MRDDPEGSRSKMVARPVAASLSAHSPGPNRPPETGLYQRVRQRELVVRTPGAGRAATCSIVPPDACRVSCGLQAVTFSFNRQALPWLLESRFCLPVSSRVCRRRIGSPLVIEHEGIEGHLENQMNRDETGVVASWITSAIDSFASPICVASQDHGIASVRLLTSARTAPLLQATHVGSRVGKLPRLHFAAGPASWKQDKEHSGANGRTH